MPGMAVSTYQQSLYLNHTRNYCVDEELEVWKGWVVFPVLCS